VQAGLYAIHPKCNLWFSSRDFSLIRSLNPAVEAFTVIKDHFDIDLSKPVTKTRGNIWLCVFMVDIIHILKLKYI